MINRLISRRTALLKLGAIAGCVAIPSMQSFAAELVGRTGLDLVIYDCNIRRKWLREKYPQHDLFEPLTFLNHCHALRAGEMQARLGVMTVKDIRVLRAFADEHQLFMDAIISPHQSDTEVDRFEAEVKTARDVGEQAARSTIIPGRRYERFQTLAEFREFERSSR